jgi:hypothetical protein
MSTFLIPNVHLASTYKSPLFGSSIGGPVPFVAPEYCNFDQDPANDMIRLVSNGGPYVDWMAAAEFPMQPNTGNFTLSFYLMATDLMSRYCQSFEFGLKITDAQQNLYTCVNQNNYQEGGQLQVYNAVNPWTDAGFFIGMWTPGKWHYINAGYKLDFENFTFSAVEFDFDGVPFSVPNALKSQPAILASSMEQPWTAMNISLGWQQNRNSRPTGAFETWIKDANIAYS